MDRGKTGVLRGGAASAPLLTGPGQELDAEGLEAFFARTPRFALAFSGGCDSAYLMAAATAAGCEVAAYYVRTAFQADFELEDARALAEAAGVRLRVLGCDILADPSVRANSADRCYRCKRRIFEVILAAMEADGFEVLADGTNASDDPARRPGFRALAEMGVVSPLRRAGMTKDEVRAASRALGAPAAGKPSFSCLAVKVPAGEPLCDAALRKAAEELGVADGRRPWKMPAGAALRADGRLREMPAAAADASGLGGPGSIEAGRKDGRKGEAHGRS